jgi:hypothetical protein
MIVFLFGGSTASLALLIETERLDTEAHPLHFPVLLLLLQLVRKGPSGQAQLVLLDHGLYRQIDDEFRREYAALWRALIFSDKAGIKQHAESMNAGDAYPLFAAMLTMRPWDQVRCSWSGYVTSWACLVWRVLLSSCALFALL